MSRDPPRDRDEITLAMLRQVDQVCDRFESSWRRGESPSIVANLGAVAEPTRAVLFRELVDLEIELRLEKGEQPTLVEYRRVYPERIDAIEAAFRSERISGSVRPTRERLGAVPDPGALGSDQSTLPWEPPRSSGPSRRDESAGREYDDFRVLNTLGGGVSGVVYRALQKSSGRIVALKVVMIEADDALLDSLGLVVQSLRHPNIVPVVHIGRTPGVLYLAMPFLNGRSLATVLKTERKLRPRRAVELLEPIARALQSAHDQSVIHGDVKPGNILLDDTGRPALVDFGLASLLAKPSADSAGRPPEYLAPEQVRGGHEVGPASDVYGLGATLYSLLCGQPPFQHADPPETRRQILEEEPVPLRDRDPALARDLERICRKCLAKRPDDRYPTAGALAEALRKVLNHEPIRDPRPWTWGRFGRWVQRKGGRAATAEPRLPIPESAS